MKKSLVAAVVFILAGMSLAWAGHFTDVLPPASASGCVPVSNGYDYNCSTDSGAPIIQANAPFQLVSLSSAAIAAKTPTAVGQVVFCNSCARSAICVSTATTVGAYTIMSSTANSPSVTTLSCQ